jgi:uncharacterized protein (DUF1330 family)
VTVPTYQIGNVTVHDAEGFKEYSEQASEMVKRYGGRYLARGGAIEVLEGDWTPNRLVVIEWPSTEHAKRWYESDEYKAIADIRQRCADTDLVLVEGL